MPSTLGGLLIFVAFLTPGLIYFIQRRRFAQLPSQSNLVELARFISISLVTNITAIGLFTLIRHFLPTHTPNADLIVSHGWRYIRPRPGYVLLWGTLIVVVSSLLALALALLPRIISFKWLAPDIVDETSWYYALADRVPTNTRPYVGLDLRDDSYVSGYVDWFSTEIDEVGDRDITLVADNDAPLLLVRDGDREELTTARMVVSARDIIRMHVSYIPIVAETTQAQGQSPTTPVIGVGIALVLGAILIDRARR